jgi:5-methyltetrahydrofolate--homocysteine methyltransferase
MKAPGDRGLIVIGENVHTTRVVLRKGKRVAVRDGAEVVLYTTEDGEQRQLAIPEQVKKSNDYEEGRVKHVKIALAAAMSGAGAEADEGTRYLRALVRHQERAGADFLDLNVDEYSIKRAEQIAAMTWLVRAVQGLSRLPVAVDSSSVEIIQAGLEACDGEAERALLNSASLERTDALALAQRHNARVIVTAAGETAMPEGSAERLANASRMVEAARAQGLALSDIYIDPLVFPASVDKDYGLHCLDAIRALRAKYGAEIHITGGMSNVSFGLPNRRLLNDVFLILALEAGADSGIIDPVASPPDRILALDRESAPYRLAADVLLGKDADCRSYLRAWRKGELGGGGPKR